jgi:hypothetical protein
MKRSSLLAGFVAGLALALLAAPASAVYHPTQGRWLSRDPMGYVDGMGLYEYVSSVPPSRGDSFGLVAQYHPDVTSVTPDTWYREYYRDSGGELKPTGTSVMEEDYWTKHRGGDRGKFRRVKDCHVVVELSHAGQIEYPMRAHPIDCSAYGHLTCGADNREEGLNYDTVPVEGPHPEYEERGEQRRPHPGLIDGFPEQASTIGPSHIASNAGRGGGPANFQALLNDAWDKALAHGNKLATDRTCCWCDEITVVFWIAGSLKKEDRTSFAILGTWCHGGLQRECRLKEIAVNAAGGSR